MPNASSIIFYPFQYILNAANIFNCGQSVKTGLFKPCKLAYFSMVDFNLNVDREVLFIEVCMSFT